MPSPLLGLTAHSHSICPPASTGIFLQRCFLDSQCQACTVVWGYSVPGAGLAFVIVELHEISVSSLFQLVLTLPSTSPALQCFDCSPHFGVTCWECLLLSSRWLVRTVSSMGSSTEHWGMPLVTSRYSSSLTVQSVCTHSRNYKPIQPTFAQFGSKDVMADHAKSRTRVKIKNTHCSPLPHTDSHFAVEGNQVGQVEFAFGKSLLTIPNHFLVLHVCGNGFQENFLHNLPADWPVVPHILLLAFLKMAIFTIFQLVGTFPITINICRWQRAVYSDFIPLPQGTWVQSAPGPMDYYVHFA